MSEIRPVRIELLSTGVPGLDAVLGDGLPEYSFNLIAGAPGTGKTTLAHQIMFANASPARPALYFTVLGEPPLKMLRYQQQFRYFDQQRVLNGTVRFVNLSAELLVQGLGPVLASIVKLVEELNPGIVMVDSFRTVARAAGVNEPGEMSLQSFVQRLALHLTSWQATTFLVGEYLESEMRDNPVFTVADGLLWLFQSADRNSIVRKLQVMKQRGQAHMPGLHTFRITNEGVQVFPRMSTRTQKEPLPRPAARLSTGVPGLDEMLAGGIPAGDAALIAGPSGSGKTVFATQFVAEGVRQGEPGILAVFEEHPQEYMARAKGLGLDLPEMARQGQLKVIYLRPLDLSVDEALYEIRESVEQMKAKRVVIDSLSGFEVALAPTFREDFRESLYRMVGSLTEMGVTVVMTVEVTESFNDLHFTPHQVSFLTDDIILQRYVEIEGQFRKVMVVVKMRSSAHSKDFRAYDITSQGIVVKETMQEYHGLITGVPELRGPALPLYPGLTDQERALLEILVELREAPVEVLAQRTGVRRPDLARAIERLVALNYAIKLAGEGSTIYRPVARPLGQ